MGTKLCQIIAIEGGVKNSSQKELTEAYHALQKPALLAGISRRYTPKDDADTERLPDEHTRVQMTAGEMVAATGRILSRLFDVTATKDLSNCSAKGDVVVDGQTLLKQVPVSTLLFIEKRLTDIDTLFKKLPTLDPSDSWAFDTAQNCYASEPVETVRTKKILRNHVLQPATHEHPAQVQVYMEDVQQGTWRTVKFSGALPAATVQALLTRVARLRESVKFARESANSIEVTDAAISKPVFDYLLKPMASA